MIKFMDKLKKVNLKILNIYHSDFNKITGTKSILLSQPAK